MNWVGNDSLEFVGLYASHKTARRAAVAAPSGCEPNARFWVFASGLAPVRLTLAPGETLTHAHGGPTEEGYHHEQDVWQYEDVNVPLPLWNQEHADLRDHAAEATGY